MTSKLLLPAAAIPLLVSSCASVPSGGYIGTDPASWTAIQNMMPGPPRTLRVSGAVTVAAANYDVTLTPRPVSGSQPEYDVTAANTGGSGTQVVTRKEVSRVDPYTGSDRNVIVRFPDGKCLKVPILRPH